MSGGVPPANAWPSCCLMSCATWTSTVLPDDLAHAAVAALTAAVSASPEDAISIFSATGPFSVVGAALELLPLSKPPPPQAAVSSASDAVAATAATRRPVELFMRSPRDGVVRERSGGRGSGGVRHGAGPDDEPGL